MTTAELVASVSEKTGVKKADVVSVLEVLVGELHSNLSRGVDVSITGLGKFITAERKARTARNPKTGVSINVDAKNIVKFKVSSKFVI